MDLQGRTWAAIDNFRVGVATTVTLASLLVVDSTAMLVLRPLKCSAQRTPMPFQGEELLLSILAVIRAAIFCNVRPAVVPVIRLLSRVYLA